jgi:nicotinamide mononucleotide transporter
VFGQRDGKTGTQPEGGLRVARLGLVARWRVAALWLAAWPLTGKALSLWTDTDVPYFNAFSTAGSFIAQVLMGLKYIECWPAWVVADLWSAALYAFKSLWLTTVLYLIFASLALVGWRRWRSA